MDEAGRKIRVLALDLDGTLTNRRKEVAPASREAVQEAVRAGIAVVLASGRPAAGIRPIAETLGLDREGGYILAYNGGQAVDCRTGKVIFEKLIPAGHGRSICRLARQFSLQALSYGTGTVIAESDTDRYVQQEAYNNGMIIEKVNHIDRAIKMPVPKFMIVGEAERMGEALPAAMQEFAGKLNVFLSEPYFMEITPQGVDKATGLSALCSSIGCSMQEVMACGDGLNDVTMLRSVGLSVAMDNACWEAKAEADFITCSNENDGVAHAVRQLILQDGDEDGLRITLANPRRDGGGKEWTESSWQ